MNFKTTDYLDIACNSFMSDEEMLSISSRIYRDSNNKLSLCFNNLNSAQFHLLKNEIKIYRNVVVASSETSFSYIFLNCIIKSYNFYDGHTYKVILNCSYMLATKNFLMGSPLKLTNCEIHFQNIENWFGQTVFNYNFTDHNNPGHYYKKPAEFEIELDDFKIKSNAKIQYGFSSLTTSNLYHERYISFELITQQDIGYYLRNLNDFLMFIKLVSFQDYSYDELILKNSLGSKFYFYPDINKQNDKKSSFNDIYLSLHILKDRFEIILRKWQDIVKVSRLPISLFFETINNPNSFSFIKFTNLAYCFDGLYNSTNKSRLSLKEVFNYLIVNCSFDCLKLVNLKSTEIGRIVNNRNYYVHFSKGYEEELYSNNELFYVFLKIKWLFIIILLDKCNIPETDISEALQYSSEFATAQNYDIQ